MRVFISFLFIYICLVSCKSYDKNKLFSEKYKDIFGVYIYHSEVRISGGDNYTLKLKRNFSFMYSSDSHFDDVYNDYGKWKISNDTLILSCEYRMIQLEKGKEKREKKAELKYKIKGNQLCWLVGNNEKCFLKR